MSGVVVTGATQPLGRRLIERLAGAGRGPLLAVGNESSGGFDAPVRYVQADLSRARTLRELVDGPVAELGIETLVHLAFHREPGQPRAHKLHVDATRLLLHLAEGHPTLRRFVHRSTAEVYAIRADRPDLLREDNPLELSPTAPDSVRQAVEADLTVCTRMGLAELDVLVLRCAEILADDMGSQLLDYLRARVCLRPLGFDPIQNVLSLEDATEAFFLACSTSSSGVFNIPGRDTLTLSRLIALAGARDAGLPGPLLGPAYEVRRRLFGRRFRYGPNAWRFHFNGVLDGARAARVLGYTPRVPVALEDLGCCG